MLPTILLNPTDLGTFTTEPNSAELLPADALEPVVSFADILQVGIQPLVESATDNGRAVPLAGNGLPPGTGSDAGNPAFARGGVLPLPAVESISVDGRPGGGLADARPLPVPAPVEGRPPSAPAEVLPQGPASPGPVQTPNFQQQPAANLPLQPSEYKTAAPRLDYDSLRTTREPTAWPQQTAVAQSGNAGADLVETALSRQQRPSLVADNRPIATPSAETQPAPAPRVDLPQPRIAREMPPQASAAPVVQPTQITADSLNQGDSPLQQGPGTVQGPHAAPTQLSQTPAQLTTPTAASAASQAQAPIDVPVKDTAWSSMLGERVVVMANNQLQNAEIRLTPAELGPLRVQVAVEDGAANVTFHAQHAVTREAIEQALPRLRELLAENGLTLNQADVGEQAGPGVQQGNREAAGDGPVADGFVEQADDELAAEAATLQDRSRPRGDGLVDTFA